MAIIKCPECGHQVSEMAPTCPNCGVQISGKIHRCPDCGTIYFKEQSLCPACHRPNDGANRNETVRRTAVEQETEPKNIEETPKKKRSMMPLVLGIVFAVVVFGVCFYFYRDALNQREQEDYEYAMKSTDPMVLQSYLDRYKDADSAHRDSIQFHLSLLQQIDEDWTNAVVSGSRTELERYVSEHPDSPHRADALNKIDSLDFVVADKERTPEAYKQYLQQHPDGKYSEQANAALKEINAKQVMPEEAQTIKGLFRRFFQAINSRNEDGLLATVADNMTTLLNRSNATKSDVVTFMNRLYKENVANMNWHIIDDYKIDKLSVGDDMYEYNVEFTAEQHKDLKDGTTEMQRYRIIGTMNADGKISRFTMMKAAE